MVCRDDPCSDSIVGIGRNASSRTDLMLANATERPVVHVALIGRSRGAPPASRRVTIGPLSFAQLSVARDPDVDERKNPANTGPSTQNAGWSAGARR